ncbi:hypothetical protein ACFY2Z_28560 [Streptomyces sp. NPDC001222]|uniref:hypothetical protein n=1 Tax=Streptomyces sp. NPDC001222 TaxID=3364548 RepID=UPI00368FC5AC
MSETMIADQLTGLPPAIINVYTQLIAFTEPATVDDIAQAAAAARSSTFKALVALEKRGLAHRDRGIQNGPNRRPDLWRATLTDPIATSYQAPAAEEPVEPATDPETEPDAPANDKPNNNSEAPQPEQAAPTASKPVPAQHTGPTEPTSPAPSTSLPAGNKRLAPGGLRQLVIEHLNARPGEAFTATRISRMIDRSSGAIANALATLAEQGLAEQVTDRPRTYRAAIPEQTA